MTAHDPAFSHQEREPNNQALIELARACTSKNEIGFEKAEKAAVVLLQRAMSDTPSANEARRLLNTLSIAQRTLYDLPDFVFGKRANA